jgi:post-segregation antitoxin (ccd killing protein)
MRTTVYLPDDLGEEVKQLDELNVSAICQEALRRELDRRKQLAELAEGMGRQEVYIDELGNKVAFTGRRLYDDGDRTAYLTGRERIAVYDGFRQELRQYDTFGDLVDGDHEDTKLVAAVAQALGEDYTIELDI